MFVCSTPLDFSLGDIKLCLRPARQAERMLVFALLMAWAPTRLQNAFALRRDISLGRLLIQSELDINHAS